MTVAGASAALRSTLGWLSGQTPNRSLRGSRTGDLLVRSIDRKKLPKRHVHCNRRDASERANVRSFPGVINRHNDEEAFAPGNLNPIS